MESVDNIRHISARKFINYCADKFGWIDLSNDVIMDVGCGQNMFCGKSVHEKFPNVRKIIGIDCNPIEVQNFKLKDANIECVIADIEKRETLENYEGKMSKVLSTATFQQLLKKEESLQNIYHLLQPGGEAAILFLSKTLAYDWLMEMISNPKWKGIYKGHCVEELYKSGYETVHYKEMAEKVGFRVLDALEEKKVLPYSDDQDFKDTYYMMCGQAFEISPESLEEFKEDSLQAIVKHGGRDEQGRPCYRSTELTLLLAKPTVDSSSDPKVLES